MENKEQQHHPFGPSSLQRRKLCPGSARMEQGLEERTSPEATYGTKLHAIMEEYVKVVHVGSNETTPENRDDIIEALCEKHGVEFTVRSCTEIVNMCEKIDNIITRFQPNVILTEQILEFCLYGEVMFYGTADLVLDKDDGDYGDYYVIDYKTGQNKVETFNNIQLQAYAACLFQKKGVKCVTTSIVSPHYDSDEETYDSLCDFAAITAEIAEIIHRGKAQLSLEDIDQLQLNPGPEQCKYCLANAHGKCSACKISFLKAFAESNTTNVHEIDDEHLVSLYESMKAVDKFKDEVERELIGRLRFADKICGYKLKTKNGNRYITDMSAAMDLADIPITDFMKYCNVSVGALQDAVCMHLKETGKCKTIKEAKQEFAERLESVIAFKEPVEFISK